MSPRFTSVPTRDFLGFSGAVVASLVLTAPSVSRHCVAVRSCPWWRAPRCFGGRARRRRGWRGRAP
ncbi:twin-arginine translocation signal domain-containing protein [Paludisphaera rhizosphaerae]|uniref:twin-arginine translocation signal domain-containing protein n=1 Tax=Paludisphaera rhizosphaerae TaxID=2711216 RepID=UPI003899F376